MSPPEDGSTTGFPGGFWVDPNEQPLPYQPSPPTNSPSPPIQVQIATPSPTNGRDQIYSYTLPTSSISHTSTFFAPFTAGYVGIVRISWPTHVAWELYQHWLSTGSVLTSIELYNQAVADDEVLVKTAYVDFVESYCFGRKMGDVRYTDGVLGRMMAVIRSGYGYPQVLIDLLVPPLPLSTSTPTPSSNPSPYTVSNQEPSKTHPSVAAALSLRPTGNALHLLFAEAIAWFASPRQIGELAIGECELWFKVCVMVALAGIRGRGMRDLVASEFAGGECRFHDHGGGEC